MKDIADKSTTDLFDGKPRRGRPATGKAKTQAQVQREYRARQKALKAHPGPLALLELVQPCLRCLALGLRSLDAHVCASQHDALLRLRRALVDTAEPGQVKCRRTGSSPGRLIQASNGAPGEAHA